MSDEEFVDAFERVVLDLERLYFPLAATCDRRTVARRTRRSRRGRTRCATADG